MSRKLANRRIRLLLFGFAVVFALLLARAFWLQGVNAASLSRKAAQQHHETVVVPAGRGTIYDRTGVQLAIGAPAITVFANPKQVADARLAAVTASQTLGIDPNGVYRRLLDKNLGFVYVERQADPLKASALERRKLPGFGFQPEEKRAYPQGAVAAQVIGFAGVDEKGLAGVELQLDKELQGRPGEQTIVKDPFGRAIDVLSTKPERPGRDVYLTIDHTIQANAESVLRATIKKWNAKTGTAIVLDPRTGGIVAMAVQPGFDANKFGTAPRDSLRNRAVTDTYEPGSTFKIVTVAGALTEGLVKPSTAFMLPYQIRVADRVIHDAEPRGTERMTVAQILSRSSNVGAITLAEKLGKQRLASWIDRFGFGQATGIDFPGESPGIVLPVNMWSGSTIGNVPIGQGIAVTPVQMASVYAAVANGGVWTQPHLLDHVQGSPPPRITRRRIVSPLVSRQLMTMLRDVVAEGTGTLAQLPGYTVAGKTGTAQKPSPHGGYSKTKYVASFVGIVPASRPRFVILVEIDEPQGAIWGGYVAAPAFQQIARFDLQYLEVPPDDPQSLGPARTTAAAGH